MADTPLRLRVLEALTACLERVEYVYNGSTEIALTDRVFRGRVIFGETDPLPMLSILEVPIPLDQVPSPQDSSYSSGRWELLVQGFVDDDLDNPTDPAHWLMAYAKAELAKERRKNGETGIFEMPKRVINMWVGAGVVRPPDEISAKAYFWLNVTLELVEDLADPFED